MCLPCGTDGMEMTIRNCIKIVYIVSREKSRQMADTITNLQEKSKGVEPSKAPKVNPLAAALPDFNK